MKTVNMIKILLGGIVLFSFAPGGNALAQDGTWTTRPSMAAARWAVSADTINGTLYVAGGAPVNNTCSYLSTLEAYDPATDTWSAKASMPTGREAFDVGVIDNILYAVGGGVGCGVYVATNEAYDPLTNSWTTKAPMPTVRRSHGVGVVDGILYVVGGHDNNPGNFLSSVAAYDPATDTWTAKAPLPTPRNQLGAGVVNGVLYAVGGYNNTGLLSAVEAYDPALDTWTAKTPMPRERYSARVEVISGILYVVGGSNNSGYIPEVDAYNPLTDTWTTVASIPTPRTDHAVAVANGALYAIGGHNGNPLAANEAFIPSIGEYHINVTAFIPGNNMAASPRPCFSLRGRPRFQGLYIKADDRSFDPEATTYRARQIVTLIPGSSDADGMKDGTDDIDAHPTRVYASDALPTIDENDDDLPGDCHLFHNSYLPILSGVQVSSSRTGSQQVRAQLRGNTGTGAAPFINRFMDISWDIILEIDASTSPATVKIQGNHDGFPAYEVYVNNQEIYTYWPGDPPYNHRHLLKLLSPMEVTIPSQEVVLDQP